MLDNPYLEKRDLITIGSLSVLAFIIAFFTLVVFSSLDSVSYLWDEFGHKISVLSPITDWSKSRLIEGFPIVRKNIYYGFLNFVSSVVDFKVAAEALNVFGISLSYLALAIGIHWATRSVIASIAGLIVAFSIPSLAFGNATMPDLIYSAIAILAILSVSVGVLDKQVSWITLGLLFTIIAAAVKPHGLFLYITLYTMIVFVLIFSRLFGNMSLTRILLIASLVCNPVVYYITLSLVEWSVQYRFSLIPTFIFSEFYDKHIQVRKADPDHLKLFGYLIYNYVSMILTMTAYMLPLVIGCIVYREFSPPRLLLLILFFAVSVLIYTVPMSIFSTIEVANSSGGVPAGRLHHRYTMYGFSALAALLSAAIVHGAMSAPVVWPSRRRIATAGFAAVTILASGLYAFAISSAYPNDSPELFGILRPAWKTPGTVQQLFSLFDPLKTTLYLSALGLAFVPISLVRIFVVPLMATVFLLGLIQNLDWQRGQGATNEDLFASANLARIEIGKPKSKQEWVRDETTVVVGRSLFPFDIVFVNALSCDCRYVQTGSNADFKLEPFLAQYRHIILLGEIKYPASVSFRTLGPRVRILDGSMPP